MAGAAASLPAVRRGAPPAARPAGGGEGARGRALLATELAVPLSLVAVVVIMVIPLPPVCLDFLLATSISLSLLILLVAMYTTRPLEFSTFPSVLLVATLFRLALNIASTRLILLHGHEGAGAAGHVIQAFGSFVVGGSYVVGMVVFLILVVINFAVITKGAGRIAEVAARFTLDAMPGKQLAIDADLNSGLISEREARGRRRAIEEEADFYGAMDGASKFVRGDAIAGVVITAINILGGFFIGVVQRGTDIWTAAQTYTILSIGDGLVAQLPALLVSTAAGIIVTRAASGGDLGSQVSAQLLTSPRVLATVAAILAALALLPGLPFLPFITLASVVGAVGYMGGIPVAGEGAGGAEEGGAEPEKRAEAGPEMPPPLDALELQVGYELVPLVDASAAPGKGAGDLVDRVRNLRRELAREMGFVFPLVHFRDELSLGPREYVILIKGNEIARGEVHYGSLLAVNAGSVERPVEGIPTREPAFGLEAVWIAPAERERAQLAGYTVVDPATVIVTHLTEVIRRHAHELLGRQEVQALLDQVARTRPKVVEELVPQHLSLGGVQRVLQCLLREGVSIRDLATILETLADHAPRVKDPEILTERVRVALGRSITRRLLGPDGTLPLVSLAPALERKLAEAVQPAEEGSYLALEPTFAQRLLTRLAEWGERFASRGYQPVLLAGAAVRPHVRRLAERYLPTMAVIAPAEIPPGMRIHSLGTVNLDEA